MTWEFNEFYEWTSANFGLDLTSYKQKQLQRRINTVMETSGAVSLEEYSQLISVDAEVKDKFLDYITINVTDFFRNPELYEEFEEILINEMTKNFDHLKIWSAACSIGSEPYSLAMLMEKHRINLQSKILATDIDEKVLDKAKEGIYSTYDLKNMDDELISKYFVKNDRDYHINSAIKDKVHFKKHDLLSDSFDKDYHIIVCRNVIIYFTNEAKDILYQQFSDSLVSGGILFTGATETIYRPENYNLRKIGKFIYQKI